MSIQSRRFRPSAAHCCEACVFGRGEHAEWCLARICDSYTQRLIAKAGGVHAYLEARPVIGEFEPRIGDVARDSRTPLSRERVWTAHGWYPSFDFIPLGDPLRHPLTNEIIDIDALFQME